MEFSRQEHCSGLPCPPPGAGELPDPGLKPTSSAAPALQADFLPLSHQGSPLKEYIYTYIQIYIHYLYIKLICWKTHVNVSFTLKTKNSPCKKILLYSIKNMWMLKNINLPELILSKINIWYKVIYWIWYSKKERYSKIQSKDIQRKTG